MKISHKLWMVPALLGSLVLVSAAQNAPAPPQPAKTMAVVDIVNLFDHLTEKSAADDAIDQMKKGLDAEYNKRQDEANALQKELDDPKIFGKDTPEYKKEQDDLLMKTMEYQAFPNYENNKLSLEMRLRTASLYKKINDAVAAYAQSHNIAMVFVADSVNLDAARSPDQLMELILTRKLLYYDKNYDITNVLLNQMNTDYALTQGKRP